MRNPILWLDDLLCTAANGGAVRIGWLAVSAAPALRVLTVHGVRTWGYAVGRNPDRRYCLVRPAQARWAVALLRGAGFSVIEGPAAAPVRPARAWGKPAPGVGLGGLVASLLGVHSEERRKERY